MWSARVLAGCCQIEARCGASGTFAIGVALLYRPVDNLPSVASIQKKGLGVERDVLGQLWPRALAGGLVETDRAESEAAGGG